MDIHELFFSCRTGDLEKITYLVEQKDIELNIRDKWDSTPLYYACLCGHIEVVKYLIEHGAKCEANTFDGERCLYGALNSDIRNLLRNYKLVSTQTIRRELYFEFLRRLFDIGEYADICFIVHGERFYAHKCILSARSDYFDEILLDRWKGRCQISIKNELVNPAAFYALLRYLYMGRLEVHVDLIDDLLRLAKQCKAYTLMEKIEESVNKTIFFQSTKPGTRVTTLVIESDSDRLELSNDFGILAQEALPLFMCNWIGPSELPFYPEERAPFADVIFKVQNHQFRCHKAFFCLRSEYFRTLLRDPFHEVRCEFETSGSEIGFANTSAATSSKNLPVVTLRDVSVTVFTYVLYYVYQDFVRLKPEHAYDVLMAADVYLLPGLKRQCAAFMAELLDVDNVCGALRTARLFELPRLEDQCYQFFAENIEKAIMMPDFHELIREDAQKVQQRQDVDSIDIIDNVRFHLTASTMDEAHEKLTLIDTLLFELGFDA